MIAFVSINLLAISTMVFSKGVYLRPSKFLPFELSTLKFVPNNLKHPSTTGFVHLFSYALVNPESCTFAFGNFFSIY